MSFICWYIQKLLFYLYILKALYIYFDIIYWLGWFKVFFYTRRTENTYLVNKNVTVLAWLFGVEDFKTTVLHG